MIRSRRRIEGVTAAFSKSNDAALQIRSRVQLCRDLLGRCTLRFPAPCRPCSAHPAGRSDSEIRELDDSSVRMSVAGLDVVDDRKRMNCGERAE
jgi:hypothetical protein